MTLLVRTDASVEIGSGHVMRCLALAQAWQSEGRKVTFLMADAAPALEARINAEGFAVIHHPHPDGSAADSYHTIAIAQTLGTKRVVVDGYHFGAVYQQQLKAAGLKMLFIDDNGHADHYAADWVLNQNIHAHEGLYPHREPYTQLLLGTEFALLRQEFWPWRGWRRQIVPVARKILVTLGGSDPDNVTLKVIQALQEVTVPNLEAIVVVGGSNPNFEGLQTLATSSSVKFDLHRNVDNMPELMAWADVAIAGGGSTCWELAFMGLPSLIIALAENQVGIVQTLASMGVILSFSESKTFAQESLSHAIKQLLNDHNTRNSLTSRGQRLVNGQGAHIVVTNILKEDNHERDIH
jgi:UDP-2,4-diacetamido-2,4,6-trideoxy-beta-L-altropyranose hydrolase